MLDKGSEEKLLTSYEPRIYRERSKKRRLEEVALKIPRRHGSLFRVDLAKAAEEKKYFVFSGFLNRFIK